MNPKQSKAAMAHPSGNPMDSIGMDGYNGSKMAKRKNPLCLFGRRNSKRDHSPKIPTQAMLPKTKPDKPVHVKKSEVLPMQYRPVIAKQDMQRSSNHRTVPMSDNSDRDNEMITMENAGILGISGPGRKPTENYWKKKREAHTKPLPPPRYDIDTFLSLKEQGFTTGLCKAVMEQNAAEFVKRYWIVDNSGSMDIKDGHRIVTTSERETVAQEVTRWEELQESVIYHSEMAALLGSPTNFQFLNDFNKPKAITKPTKIDLLEIKGAEPQKKDPPKSKDADNKKDKTKPDDEYVKYCKEQAAIAIAKQKENKGESKVGKALELAQVAADTDTDTDEETEAQKKKKATIQEQLKKAQQMLADLNKEKKAPEKPEKRSKDLTVPQSFDVVPEENNGIPVEDQIRKARMILQRSKPVGTTPLTKYIWKIQKEVKTMMPTLEKSRKRIIVIVATDGLPTTELGETGEQVTWEFVQALKSLEGLPIWLVIRLCTDDPLLRDFYNELDAQVELPLEVLDDYFGEAAEVKIYNPWINYSLPLHRCRELGYHNRVLDFLDERPLTISEVRQLASILFGDDREDIPNPAYHWAEFLEYLKQKIDNEQDQYDTQKKRCVPIIDLNLLKRTYRNQINGSNQRHRKGDHNELTSYDTDEETQA